MKDYGNAIKILRKRNQLTQAMLAEKLNVSAQAVSKWENNQAQPDLDTFLKMSEMFNITLDELTKLCDADATEATPVAEAAVTAVEAPAPAPLLMGVCAQCGRSIYGQEDLGERSPKIVCKACVAIRERKKKEEAEKKRRQELEQKEEQRTKLRRSLWIPAAVAVPIMLLLTIIAPKVFWAWLLFGVFGYGIAVLVAWDNNWVASIFEWTFGKTFAQPGLIIPLSLDGFLWALGVKIAMAIIWVGLSLAVTLVGLMICAGLLPIVLPFAIIATKRDLKDNVFMTY